jgi:alanine dehydrogenase
MPGAVPYTSTLGLTNVTLPYAIEIANKGWKKAARENKEIALGVNMVHGDITYPDVAKAFNLPWKPLDDFLS